MKILILLMIATSAWADPFRHAPAVTTNVTEVTEVTEVTNINETNITEEEAGGIALALALGAHHFDHATNAWQGSVSGGHFEDQSAGSVAIGKRFNGFLFSGSAGRAHGENAYNASAGWRW